jgi:hypothetical protein
MKVSFDYDGTLDQKEVKDYAVSLSKSGHELWIVSMRHENRPAGNQDIFDLAKELGVKDEKIIFTNGNLKSKFFEENAGFGFHLDDCQWQIKNIKKTKAVFYEEEGEWQTSCNDALS